ncbi:MAG: ATP-dependent helicase [Gemmatimonadota bacterium]
MSELREIDVLNPEQRAAVEHFDGPLLVLAGAGSGKTRVLTSRIAYLIEAYGVDPATILAVTFTNKAAGEMRERVRRLLGQEPAGLWIGTFHAIGARILRRHATRLGWRERDGTDADTGESPGGGWSHSFTIYDAEQSVREVKRVMERLDVSTKRWHPKAVHGAISGAKNQLVEPREYASLARDRFSRLVADIYPRYQDALRTNNAFDFDDLLVKPVELFRDHPGVLASYRDRFRFVLVDEYQDTNHVQYVLLELLSARPDAGHGAAERPPRLVEAMRVGGGNLMVVGDDDQSIYGWRGADIRNILDFERGFPDARVIRLERNYRSTRRILEAANQVIAQNVRRKGKTLRTEAEPGERLTVVEAADERDEADWIVDEIERRLDDAPALSPRDFVVLYRTNAQSRALEEAMRRRDLPYQVVGGTRFYERREIMDVVAYLRLISNPRDAAAFDRIVNTPRRGIGEVTRGRILAWAAERETTPLEAAARAEECDGIRKAQRRALKGFAEMMERFRGLAAHAGAGELLETLLDDVGLIEALRAEGPDGEDRIENVEELVAGAHEFDAELGEAPDAEEAAPDDATPLDRFLQKVSLVTTVDRHDPEARVVTLMTLHNAKGLEFPFVFIGGLEDGLFPLSRAYEEPDALEEERRLFYVGITRAQRKVWLTWARTRRRAGEILSCVSSSFLEALPDDLVDRTMTPELARTRYERERRWRRRRAYAGGGDGSGAASSGSGPSDDDATGGLVIDYSDAQEAPRFVKGERVRHPRFGRGTIRELTGLGRGLKAVIDFEGVGRKTVMVDYANLQKEL